MTTNTGLSGVGIGVATLGAVLAYAGFRGVSPLQALRDIASGKPPKVESNPTTIVAGTGLGTGSLQGSARLAVVAAARTFKNDVYSQAKRTQPGLSDCSSFVDKALKAVGIKPPQSDWASTANYRMSPDWVTTQMASTGPGDIAVSASHMVLITAAGGQSAIGQQRPGRNVQEGSTTSLMAGTGNYVFKTYKGYGGVSVTDPTKLPNQTGDPTLGGLVPR